MGRHKTYSFGGAAFLAIATLAGAADIHRHAADVQTGMAAIDPAKATLAPAPIPLSWIIEGHPRTEAAEIAHTDDGSTKVYVWQTSAARFNWFYESDEIVSVLDGEVFVDDHVHGTRRLGPGDVAFFPAGASTTWRVPDHLRKIATLKRPAPEVVSAAQRWLRTAKDWIKPTPAFAG